MIINIINIHSLLKLKYQKSGFLRISVHSFFSKILIISIYNSKLDKSVVTLNCKSLVFIIVPYDDLYIIMTGEAEIKFSCPRNVFAFVRKMFSGNITLSV